MRTKFSQDERWTLSASSTKNVRQYFSVRRIYTANFRIGYRVHYTFAASLYLNFIYLYTCYLILLDLIIYSLDTGYTTKNLLLIGADIVLFSVM
jgi:hypothetical protein